MGGDFSKEQKTVCVLLFASFILGIFGIYFNRVGGIKIGRYSTIFLAVALVPLTFLYLRKIYDVLDAVLTASLAGLLSGVGLGFVGLWIVTENVSRAIIGVKWLVIGLCAFCCFTVSLRKMGQENPPDGVQNEDFTGLSEMEQLVRIEQTMTEPFHDLEKNYSSSVSPFAILLMFAGVVSIIGTILVIPDRHEQLEMIVATIIMLAIAIPLVVIMRRQTRAKIKATIDEIESIRSKTAKEIRTRIEELELYENS